MTMKAKLATLMVGLGAAGLLLSPVTSFTSQTEAKTMCKTKRGKGWVWTEGMARFHRPGRSSRSLAATGRSRSIPSRTSATSARRTAAATRACRGSTFASPP